MHIVTDRGCDLSKEQSEGLDIHYAPMRITLDGETYSSGEDISSEEFYEMLDRTESMPTSSQATVGDFAELYGRLAKTDPEILSVHISDGLSGTLQSAQLGAALVPEARVTFWDTKFLSVPQAWQVEMAAKAAKLKWPLEKVLQMLGKLRDNTNGLFSVDTMRYLIHGGRISHLQGLVASILNIRPVIGIEKEFGKFVTMGKERSFRKAVGKFPKIMSRWFPLGMALRVQLGHGKNMAGVEMVYEAIDRVYKCQWLPTLSVAPILGVHTGNSVVGISAAPVEAYDLF
ncbi:MAG: DegV family protein [Anaerolineaceae bacterium]|nr:DegV family protein [Anaerolineaceae bacterium]